jgi:hypothetical protein
MLGRSSLLMLLLLGCGTDQTRIGALGGRSAREADRDTLPGLADVVDFSVIQAPSPDSPAESPRACPVEPCFGPLALPRFDANDPYLQRAAVRGNTALATDAHSIAECASHGPELVYDLDLRAFGKPTRVYVEARAAFDVSLAVEEGPLEDPFVRACNEDHAPGTQTAFLAVTLEPKQYRLIVDGEAPTDAGEFELTVELPPADGRCGAPPPNDRCEQAIPLDLDSPVQTVFGTTRCAFDQTQPLWECGDFVYHEGEVFYSLDLSQRAQPILLYATTGLAPTDHETNLYVVRDVEGQCTETLACNAYWETRERQTRLWARLEPGRYFLAVEPDGKSGDFGLSVEVVNEACTAENDTCRTAEPLEPKLGIQELVTWPSCGDDSLATRCTVLSPSPDIFYHLDLRKFEGPVHVRAEARHDGGSFSYLVLLADVGGDCGGELWCGDFDLWLEPQSYFLALDGFRYEQGPITLTLEISREAPPAPVDCIDESLANCARAHDVRCCVGAGEDCWLALASCGLRSEALACLCEAEPACCGAPGSSAECAQILKACGTWCPSFDPVFTCPEGWL